MGVNKVEANNKTLIDLTQDTVTPETLAEGATAHDASGEQITGTMSLSNGTEIKVSNLKDTSWKLNDVQTVTSDRYYEINFTSNGTEFIGIQLVASQKYIVYYEDTTAIVAWDGTSWGDANYPLIAITGGTDATNTELIDLLYNIGALKKVGLPNFDTLDNVVANYTVEVSPSMTVVDMITAIVEMGADITVFNVVNLYGYQSGTLGMQINHYGGNVYNIHAINLMTGKTLSNTNDWSSVGIGNFLVMFESESDEGGAANGFEMPQIRFTSANGDGQGITTLYVDDVLPLKLTVEIVGGGALQVGDQLQVCVRKRFNGSQANGYKRKYKLSRFAEYIVTENDLDKTHLTVEVYLNSTKAAVALFRDGKSNSAAGNIMSPLYLRIRRPKGDLQNNDSGQTVDAEFSNIVTIWKTYMRGNNTIKIL